MSGGWRDPGRVAEYLSREIPYRDLAEAMLLQALPARIERVVDLGTGTGRLIALVASSIQMPERWALTSSARAPDRHDKR